MNLTEGKTIVLDSICPIPEAQTDLTFIHIYFSSLKCSLCLNGVKNNTGGDAVSENVVNQSSSDVMRMFKRVNLHTGLLLSVKFIVLFSQRDHKVALRLSAG